MADKCPKCGGTDIAVESVQDRYKTDQGRAASNFASTMFRSGHPLMAAVGAAAWLYNKLTPRPYWKKCRGCGEEFDRT